MRRSMPHVKVFMVHRHHSLAMKVAVFLLDVSSYPRYLSILNVLRENLCKGNGKAGTAIHGTPSHSYGVSLAIWDHTVLPATRHK